MLGDGAGRLGVPKTSQDWESVKRKGDQGIKNWITKQMKNKKAVVVMVGAQTASRPWVRHEIAYDWDNYEPLVGVRIQGSADSSGRADSCGNKPFKVVRLKGGRTVADFVELYSPSGWNSQAVYAGIKRNLSSWLDDAYKRG